MLIPYSIGRFMTAYCDRCFQAVPMFGRHECGDKPIFIPATFVREVSASPWSPWLRTADHDTAVAAECAAREAMIDAMEGDGE
jgi:hypothetical protein